jgi:uroporphyrinogen decarboxylase
MQYSPDFEQLLKVLRRERPDRPVLFEFYFNQRITEKFGAGEEIKAFFALGYDYAKIDVNDLVLPSAQHARAEGSKSASQNEFLFKDRSDFGKFSWNEPRPAVYREKMAEISGCIPKGGKFIGCQPGSVFNSLVEGLGYENLCMMCYDDPDLVRDIADAAGRSLLIHADILTSFDEVGAMILNDDWGFSTQTRLAPDQMRSFVIPWYVKMVEAVHSNGKKAILHSCGNMWSLIDDVCDLCKFDGKHSYEDKILPVEKAYELYGRRIAIIGGIDVDFLCRKTPEEIRARADALLDMSDEQGGYALGSGNSIADYVPDENYLAMVAAALARR